MGLDVVVPAAIAARRAGVNVGVVKRFEDSGLVAAAAHNDRGQAVYGEAEVRRIARAHTLETATTLTPDELKRVLDAEDSVRSLGSTLAAATTALERRTAVAYVLAELDDIRQLVARRQEALVALDERIREWEAQVRETDAGPTGAQGASAARARR